MSKKNAIVTCTTHKEFVSNRQQATGTKNAGAGTRVTPATPKWLPSHLVVNSAHVAVGKEMVRTW